MRAIVVGYRRGLSKINQGVSLVRVLDWDGSTDLTPSPPRRARVPRGSRGGVSSVTPP
jgi:hypothetical protein